MPDSWEPDATEVVERARRTADDVSWAFREATRAATDLDVALARRLGLKSTDYDAMGHLMATPEPLGPNGLAQRLGITAASATELVDRLEGAGHVRRERSAADRRRVEVHAEEHTIARILGELEPLISAMDEIAAGLDESERLVVLEYLRAVSRATQRFIEDDLGA